jgi:hypothetical protein
MSDLKHEEVGKAVADHYHGKHLGIHGPFFNMDRSWYGRARRVSAIQREHSGALGPSYDSICELFQATPWCLSSRLREQPAIDLWLSQTGRPVDGVGIRPT